MKLIYLIPFLFLSFLTQAQTIESLAIGIVKYKQIINFGQKKIFSTTLYFNASQSSYVGRLKKTNSVDSVSEKGVQRIDISLEVETFVHKNFLTHEIASAEYVLTRLFTVKDSIPDLQWEFGDGEKKIGAFVCHNAFTNFRGRKYEAWFCTDIPAQNGPWKLGGLPGLILEATDSTSEVQFLLESIQVPITEKLIIKSLVSIETPITFNQYKVKWNEKLKDLKKQMQSSASSAKTNFNISMGSSNMKMIEKID
jgi:GLPGLI family protein